MIIYYALGGGWGHVSRARKLIAQLGISNYKVMISDSLQQNIFEERHIIRVPGTLSQDIPELKKRLSSMFEDKAVSQIFLDSFPAGILGELNTLMPIEGKKITYVCRYLNWAVYSPKIESPFAFDETLIIDDITEEHHGFVKANSKKTTYLDVENLPPAHSPEKLKALYNLPDNQKLWLIVHASNKEELENLISYAKECSLSEEVSPFFLVISNIAPPSGNPIKHIEYYPASDFFPVANQIFSACGYNIMAETQPFSFKHRFIPFDRKYDDQFSRAKNRRASQQHTPQ